MRVLKTKIKTLEEKTPGLEEVPGQTLLTLKSDSEYAHVCYLCPYLLIRNTYIINTLYPDYHEIHCI